MADLPKIGEVTAAMTAPVHTEISGRHAAALGGQWITRWWCFVPAKGTKYTVTRELWTTEVPEGCVPIRDIFEIEIKREPQLPGQETLPGPWPEPVKARKPGS